MKPADESAFIDFAEAARPRLRRTAFLMCGDWHLASDHVQEGLIRVYVAWPRLTRQGGELAYARKAVVTRWGESPRLKRVARALPIVSAVLITGLGLWLCYKSLHGAPH